MILPTTSIDFEQDIPSDTITFMVQNISWNQTVVKDFVPTHDSQMLWLEPKMFSVKCSAVNVGVEALHTLDLNCTFPRRNLMDGGAYKVELFTLLSPDDEIRVKTLKSDKAQVLRGYHAADSVILSQILDERGCEANLEHEELSLNCYDSRLHAQVKLGTMEMVDINLACSSLDEFGNYSFRASQGYWSICNTTDIHCLRSGWKWVPNSKCNLPLINMQRLAHQPKKVHILIAGNSDSRGAFMAALDLYHAQAFL
jgi:hypothetical protein